MYQGFCVLFHLGTNLRAGFRAVELFKQPLRHIHYETIHRRIRRLPKTQLRLTLEDARLQVNHLPLSHLFHVPPFLPEVLSVPGNGRTAHWP